VDGEDGATVTGEVEAILYRLREDDPEFEAEARLVTYRSAYLLDAGHMVAQAVGGAIDRSGRSPIPTGMSFWTDAAILAGAGIPSVLFGPGGAGLHSTVEYVNVDDVVACRDIICDAVKTLVGN
jgi:acetylornithine deacetylase